MTTPKQPPAELTLSSRSPALDAAYRRLELAYQAARREVFDQYPHGVPDTEELHVEQRDSLHELHFAEKALDDLRQSER